MRHYIILHFDLYLVKGITNSESTEDIKNSDVLVGELQMVIQHVAR